MANKSKAFRGVSNPRMSQELLALRTSGAAGVHADQNSAVRELIVSGCAAPWQGFRGFALPLTGEEAFGGMLTGLSTFIVNFTVVSATGRAPRK